MHDYRSIFEGIESTLIQEGTRLLPEATVRAELDAFKKIQGREFSDAEAHWILVCVVFYAGFRAATVNARVDTIRRHLGDFQRAALYTADDVTRILEDPGMIRNRRKVGSCVQNARTFGEIVDRFGSFQAYLESFEPQESLENVLRLKDELQAQFRGIGPITAYHLMTDLGLPVLKPDRVIRRIFRRLGLIERDDQLLETVLQGRRFAEATGHPIRYVDIVFVAYGQVESREFGLERGICLEKMPACWRCGVQDYCTYEGKGDPH